MSSVESAIPTTTGWSETARAEWLEADGVGGFASGSVSTIPTRRYHALLLAATTPPTGRQVLVNGIEAWLESGTDGTRVPLSSHRYAPDLVFPGLADRWLGFCALPWPTWSFGLPDGTRLAQEIIVVKPGGPTVLRWKVLDSPGHRAAWRLCVRLLMSGRDYHGLHRENGLFDFVPVPISVPTDTAEPAAIAAQSDNAIGVSASQAQTSLLWRPYPGIAATHACSNGTYRQQPDWYRNLLYADEQERGMDCIEDLATPGIFEYSLDDNPEAFLSLRAVLPSIASAVSTVQPDRSSRAAASAETSHETPPPALPQAAIETERQRRQALAASTLESTAGNQDPAMPGLLLAADSYLVARGKRSTLVAGYPWFTDWGRDTFIALRGLLLATGRYLDAEQILTEWAATVDAGMLPNRFPDGGEAPEYNSVDASLWYVIAVHELLAARPVSAARDSLVAAVDAVLTGYANGTRYRIGVDSDGLLAAGIPGVQLTWMDAKTGDHVVTPRIGKPVEVQALWINALAIGAGLSKSHGPRWAALERQARDAFPARFVNPENGLLFDVVDVDHQAERVDASVRPNQLFAIGGLPFRLLDRSAARRIVAGVEQTLLTPVGLRTLAPDHPDYIGEYRGGPTERDAAYHQGTVWPWLMGAFVEAWWFAQGPEAAALEAARKTAVERFVQPLLASRQMLGLGHVFEIADGNAPYRPRGCPFQAWSLGELIRVMRLLQPVDRPPLGLADSGS